METRLKTILSEILACGYADIEYALHLEEAFGEFDWSEVISERLDINGVIFRIFENAVNAAYHSTDSSLCIGLDELNEKIEINCNSLDSQLYIKDKDDCYERMYSYEEIENHLLKNYGYDDRED